MLADLVRRAVVPEGGRLLDLACGTGQLAFPLRRWFGEVWAVDQEPDMVEAVRAKAAALGAAEFRPVVADAETLEAGPGSFDLAVIGNAYHRLDRDLVAGRLFGWLRPGGCVALCWSSQPWIGDGAWPRHSPPCWTGGGRRSASRTGYRPAGTRRGSAALTPRCCPGPGSSWLRTASSPWSIAGPCRSSRGSSGRPRSCRTPCSATRARRSTRTWRPALRRTATAAPIPRPCRSCTSWPASPDRGQGWPAERSRAAASRRWRTGRSGSGSGSSTSTQPAVTRQG